MINRAAFYEGTKTFRIGQGDVMSPGQGEARLKVVYCGVCGTDVHIYHGRMDRRVRIPQVIGHEASAEVVETGPGVENVRVGDRVAARPLKPGTPDPVDNGCAHIGQNLEFLGVDTPGAMQQSWTVPASTLHLLPDGVSFEHGALIEPVAAGLRCQQGRHRTGDYGIGQRMGQARRERQRHCARIHRYGQYCGASGRCGARLRNSGPNPRRTLGPARGLSRRGCLPRIRGLRLYARCHCNHRRRLDGPIAHPISTLQENAYTTPSQRRGKIQRVSAPWLIGHFDKMVMNQGEAAVRAEFERLRPLMQSGGFIPSVDHQTPPGVSLQQYRDFLRIFREYAETSGKAS